METQLPSISARLELLERTLGELTGRLDVGLADLQAALGFVIDDDPRARAALRELRAGTEYAAAFTDPDPLISVLVPTYDRTESLLERAIPSILGQSHDNVEVIVAGDCSPPALEEAVRAFGDDRVRFVNLSVNGPYEGDALQRWSATGTPPMNAALALARGHWLGLLCDDDAYPPDHLATLLSFAQRTRDEFVYGGLSMVDEDGAAHRIDSIPPSFGHINLQSALWHGGLRFLEFELAHGILRVPNDWGLVRRMMRIGVRVGHTDETVFEWRPAARTRAIDATVAPDERAELRRRIAVLEDELTATAQRADEAATDAQGARARASELERHLAEVLGSRSWRWTAPMRSWMARRR